MANWSLNVSSEIDRRLRTFLAVRREKPDAVLSAEFNGAETISVG